MFNIARNPAGRAARCLGILGSLRCSALIASVFMAPSFSWGQESKPAWQIRMLPPSTEAAPKKNSLAGERMQAVVQQQIANTHQKLHLISNARNGSRQIERLALDPSLESSPEMGPAAARISRLPEPQSAEHTQRSDAPIQLAPQVALPTEDAIREMLTSSGTPPAIVSQQMDGREIGCLAAQRWLPSCILRTRARTLIQLFCEEDEESRRAAASLARFLCMQANHQDDIGAASAMRAYYTRIAIAEQLALLESSREFIDHQEERQNALIARGLAAGTDMTSFERQRIDVTDKRLQAESQDRQLRSLLAQLTALDYAPNDMRMERLEIQRQSIECANLKAHALAARQDLQGWIYLYCQVNEETAPVFAQMLVTIVGGWGLPMPSVPCGIKQLLCPHDYSQLAANMKHELKLIVETHRRWICQAVEEKCAGLILAYQRVELAQQTVASWESRIESLNQLYQRGNGDAAGMIKAETELRKARATEIERRLDARIAEIDLAESVGGLSDRCCSGQAWLLTGFE